jgi:peptidyl-prolyl cis-trans isomerase B (cyclophilin B)
MVGRNRSRLVTLICLSANLGALSQPGDATSHFDVFRHIEVAEYRRQLDPALVADLDAADPRVAARAALAIGRTKRAAGEAPLAAHLASTVPPVRALCAYGLGLIGDPAALPAERRLARTDANSAVRYAALDAIGRIAHEAPQAAGPAVAGDVEYVLRTDADPVVRGHAAAQLEAFSSAPFAPQVVRELERDFARERDPAVRWHAMWAIFRGFAKRADPAVLRAAAADPEELVRVEAVRAWGRRPDADPALLRRLERGDVSWRVQFEAREALRRRFGEAPSAHLTSTPPGVRLPPFPAPRFISPAVLPRAEAAGKPAAPDPERFPIVPVFPQSAREMNGPLPGPHPRVLIRTTQGDVVVRLFPEWAPSTVANFLALARRGYFDGNRWFRIVPDFVVQTGDPHGDGNGDAGYTIPAEENPVEQPSFIISMGLDYKGTKAVRDSAGTQFYLTLSPQLHLDAAFTVFGAVERGETVLPHLLERDRMLAVRRIADD